MSTPSADLLPISERNPERTTVAEKAESSLQAKVLPVALALSGLLWLGPYWVWTTPAYFRLSVVLVLAAFVAGFGIGRTTLSTRNILVMLGLLALFLYYAAHKENGGIFGVSSGWPVLIVFVLASDRVKRDAYQYFAIAFAATLIPAIVVAALSAAGVHLPWHALTAKYLDFNLLSGNESLFFRQYPFAVVRNDQVIPFGPGELMRMHGMYAEPGLVGTFASLLLVADGMAIRKRPHNIVLLIGGALSLSMAFYAIIFFYMLVQRPLLTLGIAGGAVGLVASSTSLQQNPLLSLFFLNRLTLSEGKFLGDTRVTNTFEQLYDEFWNSDLATKLFGSPHDVGLLEAMGNFSYKIIVYGYGVIGLVALLAFLIAATTSTSRSKASITLLALFILSIYQRPDVLALPYLLVLLGGAAYLQYAGDGSGYSGLHAPKPATVALRAQGTK